MDVKLKETKVNEGLNLETLELEVQVLLVMLEECKYSYCEEHQLDEDTVIDVTDAGFLKFFITEYLKIASDSKSVFEMILLVQPKLMVLKRNSNHVYNRRLDFMRIKEAACPDKESTQGRNEMLYKQRVFANLLDYAKEEYCYCHLVYDDDSVDVTDWRFLSHLFEHHAEHVNVMGGNLLYDKLDKYLTFMHR